VTSLTELAGRALTVEEMAPRIAQQFEVSFSRELRRAELGGAPF
jgi:hypothetical protein